MVLYFTNTGSTLDGEAASIAIPKTYTRSDIYLIKAAFLNFAKRVPDHVYVYVVLFSIIAFYNHRKMKEVSNI